MFGSLNIVSKIKKYRNRKKDNFGSPENKGGVYQRKKRKKVPAPPKKKRNKKSPYKTSAINYVLISSTKGKGNDVYDSLGDIMKGEKKEKKKVSIKERHPLYGEYNAIAKIEIDGSLLKEGETHTDALGKYVTDKIKTIPGVLGTKTLTGIPF